MQIEILLATLNLFMKGTCSSRGISVEEWKAFVNGVGLKFEEIWEVGSGVEGLIEYIVAED